MVYVGKNKSEYRDAAQEDDVKIPNRYSGIAFESDGTPRDIAKGPRYDPDGEELRHAEELFRRGYVFDDQMPEQYTDTDPEADTAEAAELPEIDTVHTVSEPAAEAGEPKDTEPSAAASSKPQTQNRSEPASGLKGLLSGMFGRITTEELLIGGLIVLLLSSGADDELLVMLAVLLFC